MQLVEIGKRFLVLVITLLIMFLILEQATRFYLFGFGSFNYFKMNSVHFLGISGLVKPSSHLEIIYELKPNLDTYFKMVRFKTNSQGLRDKEYTIKKPPNTFRVVVLGDSFTMPAGVDINDAFHTILENKLNEESLNISYEFINFGVGGYDPNQYLATLKYKALKYNPDLVLFCLCSPGESFYDEKHFQEIYEVKPKTHPFFESFFVNFVKDRAGGMFKKGEQVNTEEEGCEQVAKLENIFLELGKISTMWNIPICIVALHHFPTQQKTLEKIMPLAPKHGLYAINTAPAFKNEKASDLFIYKIDEHPNAKANKIFADVIYDYLKKQYLLKW